MRYAARAVSPSRGVQWRPAQADQTLAHRVRAKHGTYHAIFTTLFAKAARVPLDPRADSNSAAATEPTQLGPELTVESYDVVNGVYPSDDRVKEADALLLTGSGTCAPFAPIRAQGLIPRPSLDSHISLPPSPLDRQTRCLHCCVAQSETGLEDYRHLLRSPNCGARVWRRRGKECSRVGNWGERDAID